MANKVADLFFDRLIEWGVDTVFGLPGDGVDALFEALRTRQDKIRFIQVRHEEAATFAACAYAKFSGRLGVCLATSGPGGIHLLNGLYDAEMDGQPVLAITGHTFHDLIGTHYQQSVDLDKLFIDVAVYNERVMGPAHVVNVLDEAIRTALARRGVAHITIPKDIQEWEASSNPSSAANILRHSADIFVQGVSCPPKSALEHAAAILNESSRIMILAGAGAWAPPRSLKSLRKSWPHPSPRHCSARLFCRIIAPTQLAASGCWAWPHRRTASKSAMRCS